LKEMKFHVSFIWHYDPCGIISEMRVKNKNVPYVHTPKPEIEKFTNQTEWEPNTLVEIEQQDPSVTISQTTTPQVPKEKISRKDTSPSVTEVSAEDFQLHTKRPKTSHTSDTAGEKEIQSTTTMKDDRSLLSTSNKQIMSTVSSKKPTDTPLVDQPSKVGPKLSVFEKYDLIKKKNQTLTNNTYAQFWKQTSTTQHRLLSAFDTEKGRMHMDFLQAQVPDPKAITDYKRATFEFHTRDVHPADQMDLHRKTGEMVFSTLANASTAAAKLQVSLSNVQTQLKLEKISSFAKDNRIKTLEELVLKIGYDPSNVKAVEEMLKKKNVDIASLRKQLKLPPTEDAQAKEIAETEGEKDEMLKLIMEQNAQLKEMEAELERLVKEKEQSKPMEVIPLSTVPLTGVSTTSAAGIPSAEIPSATPLTALEKTVELEKSMEEMNLQETEIGRLKKEVENLQELKSSYQTSYSMEKQTSDKLKQELQQLQKKTVAGKTLVEAKESVWMDISKSINEIWPMVQIMFEQNKLVQRSKQAIEKIRGELGEMPTEATEIIKFLNSKTREELEELKIEDRMETILEVKRVLTKRGLMLQLEEKVQIMDTGVQRFFSKIEALQKKGLPGLRVINDKLMTLSDYKKKLATVAKDSSKFSGIQGSITGKAFLEALQSDISIQHEIQYIFIVKPTFSKYTEMDEIYRRLLKVIIPSHLRWEELCNLIE
jgi:hypothetical protein